MAPRAIRRDTVFPFLHAIELVARTVVLQAGATVARQPNLALALRFSADPLQVNLRDALSNEHTGDRLFHAGDWDLQCRSMEQTMRNDPRYCLPGELFDQQCDLQETSEYRMHMERLRMGRSSRKLRTEGDVLEYLASARDVGRRIGQSGYRSQQQLGMGRFGHEVELGLTRDGRLCKRHNGGNHRFAFARYWRVPSIPVTLTAIHVDWLRQLPADAGARGLRALREALAALPGSVGVSPTR